YNYTFNFRLCFSIEFLYLYKSICYMKKPLFLFIITCCLSLHGFSQSKAIKKLYTLYDSREFVKCVEHADKIIKKNEHELEAYYVKAIAYFEMAQLPQRYKDFTNDPLL